MKRSPIRKVSKKQAALNALWTKLKREEIRRQLSESGIAQCSTPGCDARFWDETAAMEFFHPHHEVQRSLGGEYTAENLKLLCPEHHNAIHQNPGHRFRP